VTSLLAKIASFFGLLMHGIRLLRHARYAMDLKRQYKSIRKAAQRGKVDDLNDILR
jgi:hypothetical protein